MGRSETIEMRIPGASKFQVMEVSNIGMKGKDFMGLSDRRR